MERFGLLILSHEPKGALMEKEEADGEHAGRDDLYGHWNSPAGSAFRVHVLGNAVVDPKANQGTELIGDLEETGKYAADGGD